MRLLLTLLVVIVWAVAVFANMAAAGRTAGQMQARFGVSLATAQRRTTYVVLGWTVGLTAAAVALLVAIW